MTLTTRTLERAKPKEKNTHLRTPAMMLADACRAYQVTRDGCAQPGAIPVARSFKSITEAWLKIELPFLSNGKHQVQVSNTLDKFV